jgi:3-(3-hydroxy-phenyl)propionate hydroxylase
VPRVSVVLPAGSRHAVPLAERLDACRLADAAQVLLDREGLLARRCDARPGTAYLLRPDQHVCARWRAPDGERMADAVARAMHRAPAAGAASSPGSARAGAAVAGASR